MSVDGTARTLAATVSGQVDALSQQLTGQAVTSELLNIVPIAVSSVTGAVLIGIDGDGKLFVDKALSGGGFLQSLTAQLPSLVGQAATSETLTAVPLIVGADGAVLMGWDIAAGAPIVGGLDAIMRKAIGAAVPIYDNQAGYTTAPAVTALAVAEDGAVLIGFDPATQRPIIAGLGDIVQELVAAPVARRALVSGTVPMMTSWRGIIAYGQSLSIGAKGQPPISTTPVYGNLTFDVGPKATYSVDGGANRGMLSVKPLVEDANSPEPTRGDRGETTCFGSAKAAVERAAVTRGVAPATNVYFASAAGHGGYQISQLYKGSAWYVNFIDHVTRGKYLADQAGKTFSVIAVPWIQGEDDGSNGTTQADYAARLTQLGADIRADVMAITGQAVGPHLLVAQTCAYAASNPGVVLAQAQVAAADPYVHLISPLYHLPPAEDQLHKSNVGYRWLAERIGIAVDELAEGFEPSRITPVRAVARGATVTIAFDSPANLAIDTMTAGAITDYGFAVASDDGAGGVTYSTILSCKTVGRTVVLTLVAAPGANPRVTYGLRYGRINLMAGSGAGNLCDTSPGTVTILGVAYPTKHWSPHFSLPLTVLELS